MKEKFHNGITVNFPHKLSFTMKNKEVNITNHYTLGNMVRNSIKSEKTI